MEFLINGVRYWFLMILVSCFSLSVEGQSPKELRMAFAESYRMEKAGDFTQAIKKLKSVYQEDSYELNLRLGWLNYQSGVFDESIAHYQRALNLMPYSEEAKFGLILPKAAIGKWDEVINLYNQILENAPNQTIALYRLGMIYYGRKDYNKALSYFKKVVDLYPFGYKGLIMLAWTNYQMGQVREAKVLFEKSLLYSPKDLSALEGLKLIEK